MAPGIQAPLSRESIFTAKRDNALPQETTSAQLQQRLVSPASNRGWKGKGKRGGERSKQPMDRLNSCFPAGFDKLRSQNFIACDLTVPTKLGRAGGCSSRQGTGHPPVPTLPSPAEDGSVLPGGSATLRNVPRYFPFALKGRITRKLVSFCKEPLGEATRPADVGLLSPIPRQHSPPLETPTPGLDTAPTAATRIRKWKYVKGLDMADSTSRRTETLIFKHQRQSKGS